jgi:two-component system response regulator HydG
LFYRLNVFTIDLPSLRERKTDIALLTQAFITEFNAKHRSQVKACKSETLELLKSYSWPGNVRELKNILERAVILAKGPWIEPSHLPAYVLGLQAVNAGEKMVLPVGVTAAEVEKELILRTLRSTGNNKAEAARQLGLDVKTIRNKLKSYGMD